MRICQVMLARGFGGAERYFVDLCLELARRGHEVLAACHPRGMAREQLVPVPGLTVAGVRSFGTWDPFASRRLRALLDPWRPDVVHAHLARAAQHAGHALAGSGIPLVVMTHNYVNLKYYRGVNFFLPATLDQAAYLEREGMAPEQMRVIPNFSSVPRATMPADRPASVIAMGRFVEKKGFGILVDAIAELRRRQLQVPPVLLAGDGPLRRALEQRVASLGLGELMRFAGWQQDAAAFIDRGTVFVLPSLDEPFGIAVLEAMARGVPIIATRTQGPREILDPDIAVLVAAGDALALADAIAGVLADPQAARDRALRAAIRYRERFAADAVIPQLIDVYRDVSAKHAGRANSRQH